MCVFDYKQSKSDLVVASKICSSPIIFLGYSVDAKLYHKDWVIMDNYIDNIPKIELPFYRLGIPPEDVYLVNFKGEVKKTISIEIFNQLIYETGFSPIRFENALKAYFGFSNWESEFFDNLLYSYTLKSIEIAEKLMN